MRAQSATASPAGARRPPSSLLARAGWLPLVVGLPGLVAAALVEPGPLTAAARQDWPPFVLIAGLLAVGLAARDDGLFDAAGAGVARAARGGWSLFGASTVLVAAVSAVLNLDTAVVFLTPVLVAAARRRRTDEAPYLYLAVFMANGASLLLPGSNLTNLIVAGTAPGSGAGFASRMALPWVVSISAVAGVVAVVWRRTLRRAGPASGDVAHPRLGAGAIGTAAAVGAMVALSPAAAAAGWNKARGRLRAKDLAAAVNVPVLAGLFALAVDLGTLGRVWAWPHHLVDHASALKDAVAGALGSVAVNNLPAASLLAARAPAHPAALLVGLDLGPNLAVTGALSAVLWLQVSRTLGARASVVRYSCVGAIVTVVSMTLALLALASVG